ncbi:MAG: FapA family protein [Proteobacteria bacterium]|nr:FapA family protein [Pseudomonadota bacterium]MBU1688408.1 FapA family protein [Pseudomonadota bacterium]
MPISGDKGVKVYGELFVLKLSKDKMAALISTSEECDMATLDIERLMGDVRSNGIVFGLLPSPKFQSTGKYLVAQGEPSKNGDDAKVRMHVQLSNQKVPQLKDSQKDQVDYRELGIIVNVTKGRLLLEKIPFTPGVPGKNVLGEEIKPKPGKDNTLKIGKGVTLTEDGMKIFADLDGKFALVEGRPSVLSEHVIKGDVDMSVGNIVFGGRLLEIQGELISGFQVKCRGDIRIARGVNNSLVMAGGTLTVKGSICGEEATVKVRGDAEVEFVENGPRVEIGGNLNVTGYIMQADIHVGKNLTGRQTGRVIGGHLVIGGSVYLAEMGSDAEVNTEVSVGMNLDLLGRKLRIDAIIPLWSGRLNELIKNISGLQKIKKEMGAEFSVENRERLKKYQGVMPKLMDKVDRLNEAANAAEAELAEMVDEQIHVYGTLYPGVTFRIGPAVRMTNIQEKEVVVFFDRPSQQIKIRPMTDQEKAARSL